MKNKIKTGVIGLMSAGAIFLGTFAVIDHVNANAERNAEIVKSAGESAEKSYILREYEGFVAIFIEGGPASPLTVTDIQVSTLREFDRDLLQTGMRISSHERLMMTLEDLGS